MVRVKCPIPACEFETDDLDAAIVAALISTHAKVHDTAVTRGVDIFPFQMERLRRCDKNQRQRTHNSTA